jgi:hypothetical protein
MVICVLTEIRTGLIANASRMSYRLKIKYVSRWLPTAAAWIRDRSSDVGFVVDKVAVEQVFSEYLGFPCQSSFHQFLHPHNPVQVQ